MFLQACIGMKDISANYTPIDGEGILIISITASGDCGIPYFGEIRNVDTNKKYSINLSSDSSSHDWLRGSNVCPSKKNNYYGRLAVLALPAGTYELYQFEGINNYKKVYLNTDIALQFVVSENLNNYVGNFHFHIEGRELDLYVKDRAKRDFPLFNKKYENLSGYKTIVSVPNKISYEYGR